jgi:hypothetical protein
MRRPKFSILLPLRVSLLSIVLLLFSTLGATTVVPPTFDELVQGSALVFRGEVLSVESVWSGRIGHPHLATRVTFTVDCVLKGQADSRITLEFMGGVRDGQKLVVAGVPQFTVGEHGVYFVEDRQGRVCPIMRLGHGRYRVIRDAAGGERILRDDHSPLPDVDAVSAPLELHRATRDVAQTAGSGMSLGDFEAAIISRTPPSPAESRVGR